MAEDAATGHRDLLTPQDPAANGRTAAGEPRSRSRRLAVWLVACALLLSGAAGAYWYLTRAAGDGPGTAQAALPAPPVTVSRPVQREIVEWDEFTGQFAAVEYVEIRARVSGYLQSIHFQDGQIVNQGDLLFVIDPRPFEIARASAQAQLAQAQARLELANAQLARTSQLRQRDFAAASAYDERLGEVRGAQAAVESARAAIQAAELDLQFTRITAPAKGRVSRHEVSVGNLVTGGSGGTTTLLTTIVSLDPIYFVFDLSEADFLGYQRAVAEGRMQSTRENTVPVFAHLMDETEWSLEGRMNFVDNQIDRSSGTIRARAVFSNPNLFVTPGQFGRLRLPGSEAHQAILVPDDAIVTDQSRKVVMTVKEDGTVEPRIVRPGPLIDGLRLIRSGLGPEDSIVINGLMRARPGAKVTPQPGTITPPGTATPRQRPG